MDSASPLQLTEPSGVYSSAWRAYILDGSKKKKKIGDIDSHIFSYLILVDIYKRNYHILGTENLL